MVVNIHALSKRVILMLVAGSFLILGLNEALRRFTTIGTEKASNAVCFAVDCSISMIGDPLTSATAGVQRSLTQLPDGMEAALVMFQKEAKTLVPRTTDYRKIVAALPLLSARGTTGISEGIKEAERAVANVKGAASIILFTDGKNGEERISPEVSRELKERGTALFLIGILGTEGANLKQIAEDSGGSFSTLEEGLNAAVSGVVRRAMAGRNAGFALLTVLELAAFFAVVMSGRAVLKRKEPQSGPLPNAGYLKREEVKTLMRG